MWNKLAALPRQQSARKQIRKSKDLKASLYGNFLSKERFSLISSTGKTFELFKMASPELDPQRCINCGECVKLCPTQAITENPEQIERIKRNKMPTLSLEERMDNFHVFELGFSEEMAIEEAKRCLKCGYCSVDQEKRCIGCGICRYVCPQQDVITMEALVKVS